MKKRTRNILNRFLSLFLAGLTCCAILSCGAAGGSAKSGDVIIPVDPPVVPTEDEKHLKRAQTLLNSMNVEDKIEQMSGKAFNLVNMYEQETNDALGIPGTFYLDGPRGARWINTDYGTTAYPVAAARAATWDLDLEQRIGKACGEEVRALGAHVLLAPTINQVIHPRWGRAQETYGEDSFLLGKMGVAFIKGVQSDPPADTYRIQACVKHFAANNIEKSRAKVNAVLGERTLREVFLPHFKMAVDEANVASFMGSYNKVNGQYSCMNKNLLRGILKNEWKFTGYVISDWFAQGNTIGSPDAGLDVEMPFSSGLIHPSYFGSSYFYGPKLVTAVGNGTVSETLIDDAVLRILFTKCKYGMIDYPAVRDTSKLQTAEHFALAKEAAEKGTVLLKNDAILPLSRDDSDLKTHGIVVIGKYANDKNLGDGGSSDAKPRPSSIVVTPFEGIQSEAGSGITVSTYETVSSHTTAVRDAGCVIIVCAWTPSDLVSATSGTTNVTWEGEAADRASITLLDRDLTNIQDAIATGNDRIIIIVESGGAVVVSDWIDDIEALLMAWYGGVEGGTALGEILFGDVNPSGKLCQSFPVSESDLPAFDNTSSTVNYGYYYGYRYLEKHSIAPQYHFGFGLSYTTFEYSNLSIDDSAIGEDGTLTVSVDVENTGSRDGDEVIQLYVGYANTAVDDEWGRPVKQLKAFKRVSVPAGDTVTVELQVKAKDLAYYNTASDTWDVEKMQYELYVGPSSDASDSNMLTSIFTIE
jgi:beta-glucosidase